MVSTLDNPVQTNPREYVLSVSFMKIGKQHFFDFDQYPSLQVGDYIIADSRSLGQQLGEVKGFKSRADLAGGQVHPILRPATPADLLQNQQWKEREVAVLIDCREKAAEIGGFQDVKFVAAEYNYDGSMLTYLYTSEDNQRINTGKLRGALSKHIEAKIEFRQIGPREVAKLQGGFGACGIPRCCSTFLTDFSMISINMAKAQGITLNPTEITGVCGRLRCCLQYEYEQYVEARKHLPKLRKRVGTEFGEGRVIEVHPLQDAVTVRVDDDNHFIKREDLKPLDEYEALKAAAASPCSKNAGGGCDCGSKRPRGSAKELLSEIGIEEADSQEADDEYALPGELLDLRPASEIEPKAQGEGKKNRRRRGGRNRGRRDGTKDGGSNPTA